MTTTLEAPTKTATLAERLLAITAELQEEGVTPTGRSPFSKDKALSIGDVESAITPLLVKHGVLITFGLRNLIAPHDGVREWVTEITAAVQTATPVEGLNAAYVTADWGDCGNSPAAAYSFARKSYLKQLFHIATTADDVLTNGHSDTQPAAAPRAAQPSVAAQGPVPAAGQGSLCVFCKEMDYKTSRGQLPKLWVASKGPMAGQLQCDGRMPDGGWCNHPAPTSDEENDAASGAPDFNYEAP